MRGANFTPFIVLVSTFILMFSMCPNIVFIFNKLGQVLNLCGHNHARAIFCRLQDPGRSQKSVGRVRFGILSQPSRCCSSTLPLGQSIWPLFHNIGFRTQWQYTACFNKASPFWIHLAFSMWSRDVTVVWYLTFEVSTWLYLRHAVPRNGKCSGRSNHL